MAAALRALSGAALLPLTASALLALTASACLALTASVFPAPAAFADDAAPAAKVLRVGTSGDYAPFSYVQAGSGTDGELAGFDIELAKAFARERGYQVEFVRFRWPEMSRRLAAGDFDVVMSGITMRPERSISARFSIPIAASHAVVLSWKGSGANKVSELDRPSRHIAVNAGGHLEHVARESFPHAEIVAIADNDAVRMAMLDRAYDAVVTDNFEEKVWTAAARGAERVSVLSDDFKAWLLPAASDALAVEVDQWLLAHEKDGSLAKLRERFLAAGGGAAATASQAPTDDAASIATAEPLAALAAAIVERQSLMPMVYDAKKAADKPIADPAQEAAVLDAAARAVNDAAAAAKTAPPDPASVRALFAALIESGKDVQQQLADRERRYRSAIVRHRDALAAKDKTTDEAGPATGGNAPAPDAKAATGEATAAPRGGAESIKAPVVNGGAAATPAGNDRSTGSGAATPGGNDRPTGSGAPTAAPAPVPPAASRPRVYDLSTELRPAIARVTDKIARILVAIDKPVTAPAARRTIGAVLAPHDVRAERIDAIAEAVAAISSQRGDR